MATREEPLDHLRTTVINPLWDPVTLDKIQVHGKRFPDARFFEQGEVIARILAAGIAPADLATLNCATAYEARSGHAVRHPRAGCRRQRCVRSLREARHVTGRAMETTRYGCFFRIKHRLAASLLEH